MTDKKMIEKIENLVLEDPDSRTEEPPTTFAGEKSFSCDDTATSSHPHDELVVQKIGDAVGDAEQSLGSLDFESKAMAGCDDSLDFEEQHNADTEPTMKLEFVNSNGTLTMHVTSESKECTQSERITPKTRRRVVNSDGSACSITPQRNKSTPTGKQRNTVNRLSPSIMMSPQQPRDQKPLMDLRSIIQKHEKKREKPTIQPYEKVDFYGSLSAIPFLSKKTATVSEKNAIVAKSETTLSTDKSETSASTLGTEERESPVPDKPKLPSREEITVTAEYDESQFELWKSMSALDSMHDSAQRPQEMLPLRPGMRPKKFESPRKPRGVRAFSRPEEWLNRPEMKSPSKSYRIGERKKDPPMTNSDILVMEPESPGNID